MGTSPLNWNAMNHPAAVPVQHLTLALMGTLPPHRRRLAASMLGSAAHRSPRPPSDEPDDFEPGSLPVEPDQGPVPADIPQDPEYDRVVEPED